MQVKISQLLIPKTPNLQSNPRKLLGISFSKANQNIFNLASRFYIQTLDICSTMCYSRRVLTVRKLIWDEWNISHISRHHVTPDEVEAICHGDPLILRGQQKNRLMLIGSTEEERILAVILESKGRGIYYPITAYPADKKD